MRCNLTNPDLLTSTVEDPVFGSIPGFTPPHLLASSFKCNLNGSKSLVIALRDFVHEGWWTIHQQPGLEKHQITLTNLYAVLLLVVLTACAMWTQHCLWVILEFAIRRSSRITEEEAGERLPLLARDTEQPKVRKVKQSEALRDFVEIVRSTTASVRRWQAPTPDIDRSPLFSVAALVCTLSFLVLEAALAYWLTDGVFGSPIVRTMAKASCLRSTPSDGYASILQTAQTVDGIFRTCLGKSNVGCDDQYHLREPNIIAERLSECPFSPNLCFDLIPPLQITHYGIAAFDMGVNSLASIAMDHRLVCSPVHHDSLISTEGNNTLVSIGNREINTGKIVERFGMQLETHNGPSHEYPGEQSGLLAFKDNGPTDITILPSLKEEMYALQDPDLIRSDFRRFDGRPFLVVSRAGRRIYSEQINDPFFSAHNRIENGFVSDYEATMLGCVEQYRFCSDAVGFCSGWGAKGSARKDLLEELEHRQKQQDLEYEIGELLWLYTFIPVWVSVFDSLAVRSAQGSIPLGLRVLKGITRLDSTEEQWMSEVETWFRKAYLDGIFYARNTALFNPIKYDLEEDPAADPLNLCGRILFRDGDYTNISGIGTVVVGILVIILLIITTEYFWTLVWQSSDRLRKVLLSIFTRPGTARSRSGLGSDGGQRLSDVDQRGSTGNMSISNARGRGPQQRGY